MNQHRLAILTRAMSRVPTRRDVLRGLLGAGFGLGFIPRKDAAQAKMKRKKKPRKPKLNAFGCLNVGQPCRARSANCCSGLCQGKKGKTQCIEHNTGGCQPEFDACAGLIIQCGGGKGYCLRTTGSASFCAGIGIECGGCTKDKDCEPVHGPGAACVVCDDCVAMGSNTICYPPAA